MQAASPAARGTGLVRPFVIHEHEARSHHFALRLEKDGVLWSWVVANGFPIVPGVRRLATRVEDRPLGYASFEGIIPDGEYNAATVRIQDAGACEVLSWSAQKIVVRLRGRSASGCYSLVRDVAVGPRAWWLMKLGRS